MCLFEQSKTEKDIKKRNYKVIEKEKGLDSGRNNTNKQWKKKKTFSTASILFN